MCVTVVCVCTSFLVALSNTFQWKALLYLCLYVCFRPSVYFLCPFYFKICLTLFDWCSFRCNVSLVRLFFHVFHWKWIGNWIDISVLLCTCNTHTHTKMARWGILLKEKHEMTLIFDTVLYTQLKCNWSSYFRGFFHSLHSQMEFQTDCFIYQKILALFMIPFVASNSVMQLQIALFISFNKLM